MIDLGTNVEVHSVLSSIYPLRYAIKRGTVINIYEECRKGFSNMYFVRFENSYDGRWFFEDQLIAIDDTEDINISDAELMEMLFG